MLPSQGRRRAAPGWSWLARTLASPLELVPGPSWGWTGCVSGSSDRADRESALVLGLTVTLEVLPDLAQELVMEVALALGQMLDVCLDIWGLCVTAYGFLKFFIYVFIQQVLISSLFYTY